MKNPLPTTNKVDTSKADDAARERQYKAQDALSTLEKAASHKKDRELMRDVKKLAREKVKCLKKI